MRAGDYAYFCSSMNARACVCAHLFLRKFLICSSVRASIGKVNIHNAFNTSTGVSWIRPATAAVTSGKTAVMQKTVLPGKGRHTSRLSNEANIATSHNGESKSAAPWRL